MSQTSPQALPDIDRMNALKEDFLKQFYNSTQALLPSLREQLNGLLDRLLDTDRLLADRVLSALVLVGNHKWDGVAVSLEQSRLMPNLTEEQREALQRSKREILEQDALRDLRRLEEIGKEIADALAALGKVRLPGVEERIESLGEQQQALAASIGGLEPKIEELDGQIADMTEVIHAFEAPDLQKILNRLVPTEDELALARQLLMKSGASPETLSAAARIFVEKLSGLVSGRRLIDVLRARDKKVIERGGVLDSLCAARARQAAVARELAQLPQVAALGGVRDQWLAQATTLSLGWAGQIRLIEQETALQGLADALHGMEEYLLQVRRLYEAV